MSDALGSAGEKEALAFMATILQALGIRPTKKYRVNGGQPVPIVEGGAEPLKELFS